MKTKFTLIILPCLLLPALLYPFETTVVPAWSIRVVDESGRPYPGLQVRESWKHYTLDVELGSHIDDGVTDSQGRLVFPERTIKLNLLSRMWRTTYSVVMSLAHGSLGIRAEVFIGREAFFRSVAYRPGGDLPKELIIPRNELPAY